LKSGFKNTILERLFKRHLLSNGLPAIQNISGVVSVICSQPMEHKMQRPTFAAVPTLVGSFPHTKALPLIDRIFDRFPEMPAWPQLPARAWHESMYVQYSEGLPGAVVDGENQKIYFRTEGAYQDELERFYQALVEEDVDHFMITRERALGLHLFLDRLQSSEFKCRSWLKGQVTGPFSFAMTVTDENKRSIAYNAELREVAVQGMAMKARWIARRLKQFSEGVLVVLDEPYLCSFGSAFLNVAREDVVDAINAAVAAIHTENALAGLHCCGNTDWSLVLSTGIDVLNFDAYEFFHGLPLYPAELKSFLERGGTLSWGIVPASQAIDDLNAPSLLMTLDDRIEQLVCKGLDRNLLFRQALLTPSCGLGTQSEERAERVLDILIELSDLVRQREGLR
jgi:methionine synthase II (cobalamin-independent)